MSGWRVVQGERCLEQRISRQIALGRQLLHQLFERQLLVRVGFERPLPHARQKLPERGVAREVAAKHERVHENPIIGSSSDSAAARRRARRPRYPPVRCSGDSRTWYAASRIMNGVALLAPAERLERADEGLRESRSRHARRDSSPPPGAVDRSATRALGRLASAAAPVVDELVDRRPLQPLALPDREVGVLHRQCRAAATARAGDTRCTAS